MNDFYVYIDFNQKILLSHIQKLPENWNNINGLNQLEEHLLKDLSWAGHENCGWISYQSKLLSGYDYDESWLSSSKNYILNEISDITKKKLTEIVVFKDKKILINSDLRIHLMFMKLNLNERRNQKIPVIFVDGVEELNYNDFLNLYDFVDSYIKKCFHAQAQLTKEVKVANNLEDLQKISLDVNWPKKEYQKKTSVYDIIINIISNIKELILLLIGKP